DGGATWDPLHVQLPGTTVDFYKEISADEYTWAEPRGNTIAFCVVDAWKDLFIMKSVDGGDNWTKTIVWEHPYPFFDWNVTLTTDTLWAPDNSADIAIDESGKVHMAIGLARVAHFEVGTTYQYWPYTDGIAYWNEDRPMFTNAEPHDALDAWDVLTPDYDLIGWELDLDNNGMIDLLPDLMSYRELGLNTMPNITITPDNQIIVSFAMTTEGYDNGTYNFKHIWVRGSDDNGATWLDFYDLNTDLIHIFDECIYPVMAGNTDEAFHIIYNADAEPGTALDEDHAYVDNKIYYSRMLLEDIGLTPPNGVSNNTLIKEESVSQNYPNPFGESTYVQAETTGKTSLSLEVTNLMGQVVKTLDKGEVNAGTHIFRISADDLIPGVYFYTVRAGNSSVTKKMIVE
ncbi:MAG: T9SS type A sorting domain-containing protein, partial [Bacteroidales bacterium]|nr:T9SS type A sorting domain-containing protein [Bacteroidales bacterium]